MQFNTQDTGHRGHVLHGTEPVDPDNFIHFTLGHTNIIQGAEARSKLTKNFILIDLLAGVKLLEGQMSHQDPL